MLGLEGWFSRDTVNGRFVLNALGFPVFGPNLVLVLYYSSILLMDLLSGSLRSSLSLRVVSCGALH